MERSIKRDKIEIIIRKSPEINTHDALAMLAEIFKSEHTKITANILQVKHRSVEIENPGLKMTNANLIKRKDTIGNICFTYEIQDY